MNDLKTIPKHMQADVIHSFWVMMSECESQADNNNDRVLKHGVEGWFRQWNEMAGTECVPRWISREKEQCASVTSERLAIFGAMVEVDDPTTLRVRNVLMEQLGVSPNQLLSDGANIIEAYGADSLDAIEIIMALEDEFSIEINDEDAEKMACVNDAVTFLKRVL